MPTAWLRNHAMDAIAKNGNWNADMPVGDPRTAPKRCRARSLFNFEMGQRHGCAGTLPTRSPDPLFPRRPSGGAGSRSAEGSSPAVPRPQAHFGIRSRAFVTQTSHC